MRKIIEASEGRILTNGKTYGRKIYLAQDEDESRYYEISEGEYEMLATGEEQVF